MYILCFSVYNNNNERYNTDHIPMVGMSDCFFHSGGKSDSITEHNIQ